MSFADLVLGDSVFVDANTFIYHFAPDPALGPACSQLLQRIENHELNGFTSIHVLAEVAQLMTVEANRIFSWPFTGMANRLRRHPADVRQLTAHRISIDQVAHSRMQILAVSTDVLVEATAVTQQTGLLINDALVITIMRQHGLARLASHDGDFDRVPGLTRYAPA